MMPLAFLAGVVWVQLVSSPPGGMDDARAATALTLAERAASATGPDAAALREEVASRRKELDAALRWLLNARHGDEAMRFGTAMTTFWRPREAREWHRRIVALPRETTSAPLRMALLVPASRVAFHLGDQRLTTRWARELLEIARAAGDRQRMARAYFRLSQVELRRRDLGAFHRLNRSMLAVCREAGDERCEVDVRNMRGEAARVERNYALAAEMNEKNLAYGVEHKDPITIGVATLNLAFIDLARGRTERVGERLADAIERFRAANDPETVAVLVAGLGMLAEVERRPEAAARLLGASAAQLGRLGTLPDPADQEQIAVFRERLRKELGPRKFAGAFADGQVLTLEQGISEAGPPG